MGDHLNEREIVPHVESCRVLNKRLLDYPQQRKDKETKLDFRRKFGSATHPNIPGVSEGRYSPKYPRGTWGPIGLTVAENWGYERFNAMGKAPLDQLSLKVLTKKLFVSALKPIASHI